MIDGNEVIVVAFQSDDVPYSAFGKYYIRWWVEMEGDGIHRKEIPEIPVDAMREAVINSFAHARYDLPVQHEIDIFSDRISIVNPGSFANEFEPIDFVTEDQKGKRHSITERKIRLKEHKT